LVANGWLVALGCTHTIYTHAHTHTHGYLWFTHGWVPTHTGLRVTDFTHTHTHTHTFTPTAVTGCPTHIHLHSYSPVGLYTHLHYLYRIAPLLLHTVGSSLAPTLRCHGLVPQLPHLPLVVDTHSLWIYSCTFPHTFALLPLYPFLQLDLDCRTIHSCAVGWITPTRTWLGYVGFTHVAFGS